MQSLGGTYPNIVLRWLHTTEMYSLPAPEAASMIREDRASPRKAPGRVPLPPAASRTPTPPCLSSLAIPLCLPPYFQGH